MELIVLWSRTRLGASLGISQRLGCNVRVQIRFMAEAAAGFVHFFRADGDGFSVAEVLSGGSRGLLASRSGTAANHADCRKFRHVFGDSEKFRHRAERLAAEIHVQACADHAHAAVRKLLSDFDDRVIEELGFVDSDDASGVFNELQDVASAFDWARENFVGIMALNVIRAVAAVDQRLKNLDLLARNLGALYPAQEFFGLPAEHAAANDFDRSTEMRPSAIVH